jgi:uncharacterized membrane protein
MRIRMLIATAFVLAGCGAADQAPPPPSGNEGDSVAVANGSAAALPADDPATQTTPRWDLQSSGEGVALALLSDSKPTLRLFCPAGQTRLLVNVPGFRPVGSEERLSFGSGGEVAALVADSRGDSRRGGVSGTGEVPDSLKALVGGPISASYGAQQSGPHPAPPQALAAAFVAACSEGATAARGAAERPTASTNPCLVQDGKLLRMSPLRAVGTEPFWGARIEGRCVTYSHPEDQKGTRIWTRFAPGPDGGIWTGALGGRPFRLVTRTRKDCSDGMSDKRYPFAVELVVAGERRSGCAEPLSGG